MPASSQPGAAPETRVAVANIRRDYGQGPVLDNLSFTLAAGETLAVIGPSGCGKSSLLYLLAGLAEPQAGAVTMRGPHGDRPRIAFILQDYGLFPWKSVWENVALPLELAGTPRAEQKSAVAAMLAELQLDGLDKRYPDQLSGGQRQRVAVGRALVTSPDILLMDEPFSSLDAITREQMQNLILQLWRRRKLTTALVTHSVSEAAFLGKYVMVLGGRPARSRLWLENPWFGDPDCRGQEGFFDVTRRIYQALAQNGG
jgi:NitT/TauT family transport system ATP-binding protein